MGKLTDKYNLAKRNPFLTRQWHPIKNKPITPQCVTPCSHRKAWWICKKKHVWQAIVKNRNKGAGCPTCAGQKVSKDNCLKKVLPELAKQWFYSKNNKLTPLDITAGSGRKFWWQCPKDKRHIWRARVIDRKRGFDCPICAGKLFLLKRKKSGKNLLYLKKDRLR